MLALLRRVTESRRGGISRESQLRHLAAWFSAVGSPEAAHALFDAAFGLGAPRHVAVAHPDPEAIPTRQSWWEAPAVELSRTLVQSGRLPGQGNGRPARLDRQDERRAQLRHQQLEQERRLAEAGAALVELGSAGPAVEPLDPDQTGVLLRLLDIALATRSAGARRVPLIASAHGVRLTLTPADNTFTSVPTRDGVLRIDGFTLTVTPAQRAPQRARELVAA